MKEQKDHPYITTLKAHLVDRSIDRREFLRTATLLGMSASVAYAITGKIIGENFVREARAAMPRGGTLRIGMYIRDISDPHTISWSFASNVVRQVAEYLTKTGQDNITRPYLVARWEASDDLKTWTLHLRKRITWHNGRDFTADDVVWNMKRVLDENIGSSVLGLMKGYMLEEYKEGGKTYTRLWDANAIERVDAHTVRLNCQVAQLAVPEHLFHYPFLMIDPEEGGVFGPGSNGTGAFELIEHQVGEKSVLKARHDYWGEGPYVDTLEFVDIGDDPETALNGLAMQQIHGLWDVDVVQIDALKLMPHLQMYEVPTAVTGVVRGKVTQKPFDDPLVRRALRLAVDPRTTQQLVQEQTGLPGEHHHVCPIHPEYAKRPLMERNVQEAKRLLVEAGYPDGIDLETIDCNGSSAWEFNTVQAIAEQWKEAGIGVRINVLPSKQFWEIWNTTRLGFTAWTHRPLGVIVLGLAYRSGVPWNESEYANPEFDRLLTEAEGILDVNKRREVMAKLERIMQEDGPIVQPFWRPQITFMDRQVKGFKMHPAAFIFANEIAIDV